MRYGNVLLFISMLVGQTSPTIPENVFRFSLEMNMSNSMWELDEQTFDLRGIGRHYFDNLTRNDSGGFSSKYDLYHNGTHRFDSGMTIEEWLTQFNLDKGTDLPTFGPAAFFDTSKAVSVTGQYFEKLDKKRMGESIKIEYGMSNEITLAVTVPIINSFVVDQSLSATGNPIDGVDDLVEYHQNAMDVLDAYSGSKKDTIKYIHDLFYSAGSQYNVLWILHSKNDPLNLGFIDSQFIPNGIQKDTVTLADLIPNYYPGRKAGFGVNDVKIGVTFLLNGSPSWAPGRTHRALYGHAGFTVPFGYTISSYKEVGAKQFKEIKIGAGTSRWSFGLYGDYVLEGDTERRLYFNTTFIKSNSVVLNTPVALFSGGHTRPDSILSHIGSTYRFQEGNWMKSQVGYEFETTNKRIKTRFELMHVRKSRDKFVSLDPGWDDWMAAHDGYDSEWSKTNLKVEFWFLNSHSSRRFGPYPFDLYGGFQQSVSAIHTYSGWFLYSGITTYFQAW